MISKEFPRREISQIKNKTALNNFQQNRCAYIIQNLIQAPSSKGHPNFGLTRGIQYIFISLFSIFLSKFNAVSRWNRHDTEYVIEKDNALNKLQNTDQLLSYNYSHNCTGFFCSRRMYFNYFM